MASDRPAVESANNEPISDSPRPLDKSSMTAMYIDNVNEVNFEGEGDTDVAIETEQVTPKAPDGGWGWFVVLAAVVMRILTSGMVRSNGLFYVRYIERFGGTSAQTAWVTSLNTTCNMLMGPFVNILCNRFTAKRLSSIGAIVYVASLFTSGFATNLVYMYFTYGVLCGIGRSFMVAPTSILLGYYFDKRRSLAFSLTSAGIGIGGFTITPAISPLFEGYGFTGTFIFLSGLTMNTFVCVMLLRPIDAQTKLAATPVAANSRTPDRSKSYSSREQIEDEDKASFIPEVSSTGKGHLKEPCSKLVTQSKADDEVNCQMNTHPNPRRRSALAQARSSIREAFKGDVTKKKLFSFSVFKDIRFLTLSFATFLNTLPNTGLFLPALAMHRGLTDIQTGLLLTIMAISDTVTRVACGFVLDLKPLRTFRPFAYNCAEFISCVVLFTFPAASTFSEYSGLCCIHGFTNGIKMAQRSVILVDILGVDRLTSSSAIIQAVMGIGTLIGPPISGWLKDTYGKYDYTFYFGGTAAFIGAIILAGGNIQNYYTKKSKVQEKSDEAANETADVESERSGVRNQTDSDIHEKDIASMPDSSVDSAAEPVAVSETVQIISDTSEIHTQKEDQDNRKTSRKDS